MKLIPTIFRRSGVQYLIIFGTMLFFQNVLRAQSTPVYAGSISDQDHVDNAANAIDGSLSTRARIRANSGIAVGIGSYDGSLELQFPSTLPANTTSFVRIQTDDNLLPSLLGGSLGTLLSDVAGTALIGNQEFLVQAKNNSQVVLQGYSKTISDFFTPRLKVVVNANGEYFLCITPSQAYNRIRLTNHLGSLIGLNNTKNLDVYEAFYNGTPDPCGGASYTSYDGIGLNLDLLNIGGAGVINPQNVIDANQSNYSRLSLGIIAVAASVEQTVYFDGLSASTDQFLIRLKLDPALVALGVANNIQIIASNGPNQVQAVYLNSLLNLDLIALLQGNQIATIPFSPGAPVNRITLVYSSLLNTSLSQGLNWYGASRAPATPTITDSFTANNPAVCAGSSASLIVQSTSGTQLYWYSAPTGGTLLGTTNSGQAFNTGALTQDTWFYVSAKKNGCPEESPRLKIKVSAVALPVASDINVDSEIITCSSTAVIAPSSAKGSDFHYYRNQAKTSEILDGEQEGEQYVYHIDPVTGALTVEGLLAEVSPYKYYIAVRVAGNCENAPNTLKEVTINYPFAVMLFALESLQGCGTVNLTDAIINFDTSGDVNYSFYDASNNPVSFTAVQNITESGTYSIQATDDFGSCPSYVVHVDVTVNQVPTLDVENPVMAVNTGNSVTFEATSNTTITWYDSEGTALPSNTAGPFLTSGFYTFTAVASSGVDCYVSQEVSVTVVDPVECPPLLARMNAVVQGSDTVLTGTVFNPENAVDGDPNTFSTITTGIGLLGIGTTQQNLQWMEAIPAGTPVTVKLGSEYSGLVLAGACFIVGTVRDGSGIPTDIGDLQPVSGSLVDLLSGQNTFEYTFVPSDSFGEQDYDGIRIVVTGIASVSQNVKVYEAYYNQAVTEIACGSDVQDIFYGAVDLGIGATTVTVGVDSPYDAVDTDPDTYATMYSGAGILAAAEMTAVFRTPAFTGDTLAITISKPGTALNLNLLTGFTIQLYMGSDPVGDPIDNTSALVSLSLIDGGDAARILIGAQPSPYDRIKIRFGGAVSVLDLLRVHDIQRYADTGIFEADADNAINACPRDVLQLNAAEQDCTSYIWYDAPVDGNIVAIGSSYMIPVTLPAGIYTYYIQPIRYGCTVYGRGIVTVNVCQNEDNTPRRDTSGDGKNPCLTVFNSFSPNGDGVNDTFRIECIEDYRDNKLDIYDRSGILIYTKRHYANQWDGSVSGSGTISDGLYLYVLDAGVDGIVKRGWVHVSR